MNNTALKIIAALLTVGAIVIGFMGIRLSQQPAAPAPAPAAPSQAATESVVVAARKVKAGQIITAADLGMKSVVAAPSKAYRERQDVLGKTATSDIDAGATLTPDLFVIQTMANAVHAGERALAVLIDEVIGIGGFARPGDHVDVVWYQPGTRETNDTSSAQIVIENARLLSFGDNTVMDVDTAQKATSAEKDALDKSGVKNAQEARDRKLSLRSAVLAVPETDVPRLMVAASSGTLRLVLRPAEKGTDTQTMARKEPRAVTLPELTPVGKRPAPSNREDAGVVIQEGSKERRIAGGAGATQP